jgi:SAM-dependent methyltransferase
MSQKQADDIRQSVRDSYSKVAEASDAGECCGVATSCCGVSADINSVHSTRLGNSEDDLKRVPGGADMGLGCGNPRAIASLQADEVVLDLGSGGGFDAFLATREIGTHGRVIGVDMTPAMVSKARANAAAAAVPQVEFYQADRRPYHCQTVLPMCSSPTEPSILRGTSRPYWRRPFGYCDRVVD